MNNIVLRRHHKKTIGFADEGKDLPAPGEKGTPSWDALGEVLPEDLIRFGFIPELVGRLPVMATLSDLDEGALVEILTEPNDAVIKQFQHLFAMDGITLHFTPDALRAIAKKAFSLKMGARGLRRVLENFMTDLMFDAPSAQGLTDIEVTANMIEKGIVPLVKEEKVIPKASYTAKK